MTRNALTTMAAAGRALVTDTCLLAGTSRLTSVSICDDRPAVQRGVAWMLRPLPSLVDIDFFANGFALTDAFAGKPADLVLIGIHPASGVGTEATSLLLGMDPFAVVIVYGRTADIDVLAAAYIRGARGLLLWNDQYGTGSGPST